MMPQEQQTSLVPIWGCPIQFSNKRNQGLSERGKIPGLGQEINKMILEHLIVSESKEMLEKKNHY